MQTILADLTEELSIPLHPPEKTDTQDTGPVDRKQSSNRVELAREDLEYYQCE